MEAVAHRLHIVVVAIQSCEYTLCKRQSTLFAADLCKNILHIGWCDAVEMGADGCDEYASHLHCGRADEQLLGIFGSVLPRSECSARHHKDAPAAVCGIVGHDVHHWFDERFGCPAVVELPECDLQVVGVRALDAEERA